MDKIHLTLRESIKVTKTLKEKGFTELHEKISNHEGDEEYMVAINKAEKEFALIDHENLMKFKKQFKIKLTHLKEIEKWNNTKN